MKDAVPGTGWNHGRRTDDAARRAVAPAGVEASVHEAEDMRENAALKVLRTPAAAIDGKGRIAGRAPLAGDIRPLTETRT